jgi:hypothetical protein
MFPLSYVRLDAPPTPVETSRDAPPSSSNRAVALYAFEAETDHDLSLKVRKYSTGGGEDELKIKIVFGVMFFFDNVITFFLTHSFVLLSIHQRQEGDIVRVIESVGNGWLYGEDCQSGRRGQFPESFVRRELN